MGIIREDLTEIGSSNRLNGMSFNHYWLDSAGFSDWPKMPESYLATEIQVSRQHHPDF